MTIEFNPTGVCAQHMRLTAEDGIVTDIQILGGCDGNLSGITKLALGMKITDLIERLDGIDCRGRGTSCPAQLAIAAKELLVLEKEQETA